MARATPRFSLTQTSPRTPCVRGNRGWAPCRTLGSPQCPPMPASCCQPPHSGRSYPLPAPPLPPQPPARTGLWMPLPAHPAFAHERVYHAHTHTGTRAHSEYLYLQESPGWRRRREAQGQKQVTCRTDPLSRQVTRGLRPWRDHRPLWASGMGKPTNLRDPSCPGLGPAAWPQGVGVCWAHVPKGSGDVPFTPSPSP